MNGFVTINYATTSRTLRLLTSRDVNSIEVVAVLLASLLPRIRSGGM